MPNELYTIGHLTDSGEHFVRLLQKHGITAIADVRSSPYSLHNPQFNREELRGALKNAGILLRLLGQGTWCEKRR